ncbi:MAG: NAD(P)/FAD-dependent oxidoreductase [Bacteroidota bacterium]
MKNYKYVIIGGGTTAGYAAKEFTEQGIGYGELCIISDENILPMNRPPFSKNYLVDPEQDEEIPVNDRNFYSEHGIEVLTETITESVDLNKKEVTLESGEIVRYEKLLIATGSEVIIPEVENDHLNENVFYLRTKTDADQIRKKAKQSKKVVVAGGSYIGTETAASLSQMGLKVTMVVPEDKLLARFATDEISNFFVNLFREKGIEIIFNEKVVKFEGESNRVNSVVLGSGRSLDTDMVIMGTGVEPAVNIFRDTDLSINYGIIVNRYLETNIPDVYAAGDVVIFPDIIFDKINHVEHWQNAFDQGKHAAKVMTGHQEPYIFEPYFFSDIFDLSYEYFGDNELYTDIKIRGNLETGDFSIWWFDLNRLVAAFIMGKRPDAEREKAKEWIRNKQSINMHEISNGESKLEELLL